MTLAKKFFGLPLLPANDVPECFVQLMSEAPTDDRVSQFADFIVYTITTSRGHVVRNHLVSEHRHLPQHHTLYQWIRVTSSALQ